MVKWHIMKHSVDSACQRLYETKLAAVGRGRRKANTTGPALVDRLEGAVEFEQDLDGLRYSNRKGIGAGQQKAETPRERRPLMIDKLKAEAADELEGLAKELQMQGEWLQWSTQTVQWQRMTYHAMCNEMSISMVKRTSAPGEPID